MRGPIARHLPKRHPIALARRPLAVALTLAGLAGPLAAQTPDHRWTIGVGGIGVLPAGNDARADLAQGNARFAVSDGGGFGLSLDYRIARRLSIELSAGFADLDTELQISSPDGTTKRTDSMEIELFGVGVNYRLLVRERFDLYLGGAVLMSKGSDQVFLTGSGGRQKLTFDDDFGYRLSLGVDLAMGSSDHWLLRSEVGYLTTILETDSDFEDLDLDPLMLRFGLGYRF